MIGWAADKIEDDEDDRSRYDLTKPATSAVYVQLFQSLFRERFSLGSRFVPWPMQRLGKLPEMSNLDQVAVWLASPLFDDPLTKHLVRSPSTRNPGLRSLRYELMGLAALRNNIRLRLGKFRSTPRRRHFFITSSIRLSKSGSMKPIEREFDGGVISIFVRSGKAEIFLLESKSGNTSVRARNELTKKMGDLGLNANIFRLGNSSAYAALR